MTATLPSPLSSSSSSVLSESHSSPSFSLDSYQLTACIDPSSNAIKGVSALKGLKLLELGAKEVEIHLPEHTQINRIYCNDMEVEWHGINDHHESLTEPIVHYHQRVYSELTSERPNVAIHIPPEVTELYIDWTTSLDAIDLQRDHSQILCEGSDWFPCHKYLSCKWSLDMTVCGVSPEDAIHFNMITNVGPAETIESNRFVAHSIDSLPSNDLLIVFGFFLSIPMPSFTHSLIWFPPEYANRIKHASEFIQKSSGFPAWYLHLHDLSISSLSLIFARQVEPRFASKMAVLPIELAVEEREVDSVLEFRVQWSTFLCSAYLSGIRASEPFLKQSLGNYLSLQLLRFFHGDNEMRWHLWSLADLVNVLDESNPTWSIHPQSPFALVHQQFGTYAISKLTLVWHLLHDRLSKTTTSIRQVIVHIYEAFSKPDSESFTSKHLFRIIKQHSGHDLHSLWDQLLSAQGGGFCKNVSYVFNRKRMMLELELTDAHAHRDTFASTNYARQAGTFCLRVLEINGTVYEHNFPITSGDTQRTIDIPVHCKIRKPHRRRRKHLPQGEGDEPPPSNNNDNEAALKDIVLTPPIKWIRPDPHWSWPLARFFVGQTDLMCCSLLLKDGLGDIRSQLYALQSLNKLTRRKSSVHEQVLGALEKVILDARSFFQVRMEAVKVLCDIGPSALQRALSILARKFGIQQTDTGNNQGAPYSLPLRANNFVVLSDYFIQRSFARFLPLCIPAIDELGEASMHSALINACTLVQLEVDFLRYNDNTTSENTVSDSEWIADVFRGLGASIDGMLLILERMLRPAAAPEVEEESFDTLLFDRQPVGPPSPITPAASAAIDYNMILNCLGRAVQQIDRYVTREHILPSHQNTILQAIMRHPWSCLLKHSLLTRNLGLQSPQLSAFLGTSLTGIPNLLLRYSGNANYWRVRLAALEVRLQASVQCIFEEESSGWTFFYEVLSTISTRSLPRILSHSLLQAIMTALIGLDVKAIENPDLKAMLIETFEAVKVDRRLALQLLRCFIALYPPAADAQEVPPLKLPTSLVVDAHAPMTESQQESISKVRIAFAIPIATQEIPPPLPRIQLKPPPPSQDSSPTKQQQPPKESHPLRVTLRLPRPSLSQ